MILLIGYSGMVGPRHIKAWDELGMPWRGAGSRDDWLSMMHEPDIDLVDIATPIYLHTRMIREALRAGHDVICEKPLACTVQDGQDIADLYTDKKIGIIYQYRFNPKIRKLKREIEAGKYGEIKVASINYYRLKGQDYYNRAWRANKALSGGGTLFNITIHYLDILQWLFGYPTAISGYHTTSYKHIDVEDTVTVSMKFPNGAIGSYTGTTIADPQKHTEFIVYGTKGGTTIQLRENEYHKQNFQAFLQGSNYVTPHEALKSLRMAQTILA